MLFWVFLLLLAEYNHLLTHPLQTYSVCAVSDAWLFYGLEGTDKGFREEGRAKLSFSSSILLTLILRNNCAWDIAFLWHLDISLAWWREFLGNLFVDIDNFGERDVEVGDFLFGGTFFVTFLAGAWLLAEIGVVVDVVLRFILSNPVLVGISLLFLYYLLFILCDHIFNVNQENSIFLLNIHNPCSRHDHGLPWNCFIFMSLQGSGGGEFVQIELELAGKFFDGRSGDRGGG